MSEYTYAEELVSDLHKDAYGVRPSEYFWEEWSQATPAIKQEIWDHLLVQMEKRENEDERQYAKCLETFRANLRKVMDDQRVDWRTAMRWLMQADGEEWAEHWLWSQGISWEKIKEIEKLYLQDEAA